MKATCLIWTAIFFALAGASAWFVYRRTGSEDAAVFGAFIGGVTLLIAVSWISAIPARLLEWWRIVSARWRGEPVDGQRVAIVGTLRGHGEILTPFSQQRALVYAYEIVGREGKLAEGFESVPLSIEHDGARTRIAGKPELLVKASVATGPQAETRAKEIAGKPVHAGRLSETFVAPDTNVCVIGTFQSQALVDPITLRAGSSFGIDAAWRVVNAGIAAVIFAFFAVIALLIFCAKVPLDASPSPAAWWEIDFERFIARNVREPMIEAGMLTAPGFRLPDLCIGCAVGRMEIGGRVMELRHARGIGGRAVHLSEREGATDGLTLLDTNHIVLTINGKPANVPRSWLQDGDVVTSLGSEGEFAGRVTVIAPDGWIRCRVAFHTRVDPNAFLPGATKRPA